MKIVSSIGLGTAALGRPQYINIRQGSAPGISLEEFKSRGMNILQTAYDLGIRYFDTAPGYGFAEQLMIDWLHENKELNPSIASKWGYTYMADFDPNAKVHEVKEHSIRKLNEQWKTTKKLIPSLKYYQIHSATFESGVLQNNPVLDRLAALKEEYNLLIGLTTSGANQVEVLEKALEIQSSGKRLFDLFQVTYNVFEQSIASALNSISDPEIKIVIKEALANGRIFPNKKYSHYLKAYRFIEEMAAKYNVGVDAVAMRFCIDSIPTFKVLSGAATVEHLKSNLKMTTFQLEPEDIENLKLLKSEPRYYWNERKKLAWN